MFLNKKHVLSIVRDEKVLKEKAFTFPLKIIRAELHSITEINQNFKILNGLMLKCSGCNDPPGSGGASDCITREISLSSFIQQTCGCLYIRFFLSLVFISISF